MHRSTVKKRKNPTLVATEWSESIAIRIHKHPSFAKTQATSYETTNKQYAKHRPTHSSPQPNGCFRTQLKNWFMESKRLSRRLDSAGNEKGASIFSFLLWSCKTLHRILFPWAWKSVWGTKIISWTIIIVFISISISISISMLVLSVLLKWKKKIHWNIIIVLHTIVIIFFW